MTLIEVDNAFQPAQFTASVNQAIEITNNGQVVHNFTIEGSPVDVDTQPGEITRLDPPAPVDPGTYTFFCKFHRAQGMEGTIEVTA